MKRVLILVLTVGATSVVLTARPVQAYTRYPTSVALAPSKTKVAPKTEVKLTATVTNQKRACSAHRPVKLYRDGALWIGHSTKTDANGVATWTVEMRKTTKFQALAKKRLQATYPVEFVCGRAWSPNVTVTVVRSQVP